MTTANTTQGFRNIDTANLVADANQPREHFAQDALDKLAASLKRFGLLQPITVTPIDDAAEGAPQFMIVDGERRFRAAQQLGWKAVRAIVGGKEVRETQGRREAQLVANMLREDLLPSELAKGLKESQVEGSTVRELETMLGIGKSEISDRVKSLTAPDEVKAMVDAGELNYQVAAAFSTTVKGDSGETLSLSPADKLTAWSMIKAEAERTGRGITRTMARAIIKAVLQPAPVAEQAEAAPVVDNETSNDSSNEVVRTADTDDTTDTDEVDEDASQVEGEYVSDTSQAERAAQQLRSVGLGIRQLLTTTQESVMHLQGRIGDANSAQTMTDALCEMAGEMDPEGVSESINFLVKHLRRIGDAAKAAHARRVVSEQAGTSQDDDGVCGEPNCDADVWVDGRCYEHSRAAEAVKDLDGVTEGALEDLAHHMNGHSVA